MSNNIQQFYKTQEQYNKKPTDINTNTENTDTSSITPAICIKNKIKCNKDDSKGVIYNDLDHNNGGGNCNTFMFGSVNVPHDLNAHRAFSNSNVTGVTDPITMQFNMFEQEQNIYETLITKNVIHMLLGEKQIKKKHVCCFENETNNVGSMTTLF
jgi:hypothetical protein